MRLNSRLCVVACGLALSVTACASSSSRGSSARELTQRLNARLAPEIATGRAVVQPLPDGARVILSNLSLSPGNNTELDGKSLYVVASVIQGLLAPNLLLIEIEGSPVAPAGMREAQAGAVAQFFGDYGINASLQPPAPAQGALQNPTMPGAAGPAITITMASN
jgi:hypothetical protein